MSLDAPARTDHVVKLLVTGPFGAGKTTLISSISQTPVVDTDVATTGDESLAKTRTTVAMDFGTYRIDDADGRVDLLMFGTPGQARFRFMTEVMKGDVDAVISVIDATDDAGHVEAGAAMRDLQRDLHAPLVIAVNRCDDEATASVIARRLGALATEAAIPCQLIDAESGRAVIVAALIAALDRLERPDAPHWRPPLQRVIDAITNRHVAAA